MFDFHELIRPIGQRVLNLQDRTPSTPGATKAPNVLETYSQKPNGAKFTHNLAIGFWGQDCQNPPTANVENCSVYRKKDTFEY